MLGGVLGGLALLYYGGVNAVLASPLGPALFNAKPDQVQVHYLRAWTLVPGRVEVRGFQLSMQDRHVQLMITADRVQGDLHPWTLRQLRFYATDIEAEGISLRLRPLIDAGDPTAAHLDELPPIAGFPTPVRDDSAEPGAQMPKLVIELANLKAKHVREVWIDRLRYTGDAEVTGGMRYKPLERLRLDDAHFTDTTSNLIASGRAVAIAHLELKTRLHEVDLPSLSLADFQKLSAELELEAFIDPRFLNTYLTRVKGLSTLSASGLEGQLKISAKIDEGVLQDGAQLRYQTPRVAVRIPFVDIGGAATVQGHARDGKLGLEVDIAHAVLRQRDGEQLAQAALFSLGASGGADLTKLHDVDALLTLTGGRMKKLSALNDFIPAGAGVRVTSGEGELEGKLRLDASSARGRGSLELTARDVTVKNRSATLIGRLQVHGDIRGLDLTTGALDLSGSSVALEDSTLNTGGKSWPMWVRAVADPCLLTPHAKVQWSTTLTVGASNLQPMLAIVSANVPVPAALRLLTNSPNVRVEAKVEVKKNGVELPRLLLTSQSVRVEGALSLREAKDERLEPWGNLLLEVGVLKAGLQLEGQGISVVMLGVEKWAAERNVRQVP